MKKVKRSGGIAKEELPAAGLFTFAANRFSDVCPAADTVIDNGNGGAIW